MRMKVIGVVSAVVLAVHETVSAEEHPLSENLHHNTAQQHTYTRTHVHMQYHTNAHNPLKLLYSIHRVHILYLADQLYPTQGVSNN